MSKTYRVEVGQEAHISDEQLSEKYGGGRGEEVEVVVGVGVEEWSESESEGEPLTDLSPHSAHILAHLLPYWHTPDAVAVGQCCSEFNRVVRPRICRVTIPDSFDVCCTVSLSE